ncbi:WhiB family transcriptional regulator [Saccharopolyspora taberi]|uniref:4Fe-4S Wbl-type domain-containing protein n=1 Tax=Saccharopolyspora taberi TaxID=60895 RepID=A0ABN3VHV5_9PSEU
MTNDRWLIDIARRLDRLRAVPSAALAEAVERNGKCLWEFTEGAPLWAAKPLTDRELAALLCAGCPVEDECLELELRMAGTHTVGVWGALAEDDRRALHPYWLRRNNAAEGGHAR